MKRATYSFVESRLLAGRSHLSQTLFQLIALKQIGNLSGIEDVVDVFQKLLDYYLSVCEEEHSRFCLGSRWFIELLEIFTECGVVVATSKFNLNNYKRDSEIWFKSTEQILYI